MSPSAGVRSGFCARTKLDATRGRQRDTIRAVFEGPLADDPFADRVENQIGHRVQAQFPRDVHGIRTFYAPPAAPPDRLRPHGGKPRAPVSVWPDIPRRRDGIGEGIQLSYEQEQCCRALHTMTGAILLPN